MAWDEERVEQLKQLWAEGLSASQIASKMGGVTRNAVIGKVHRLGLSGRATPAKPQRGRSFETPKEEEKPGITARADPSPVINEPEFTTPLVLSSGDRTTVATLKNNMCKWPVGDPASDEFHFCGQSTSTGKSYCPYHAHMAFQPSHRKPERRPEPPRIAASGAQKRRAAG